MTPDDPRITNAAREGVSTLRRAMHLAFADAMVERTRLPPDAFRLHGFSGRKFRMFMNGLLAAVPRPRYLEIGLFAGASFCPAIYKNNVSAVGIDNWDPGFGMKRETFLTNLDPFREGSVSIDIVEQDFRTVNFGATGPFNVIFYDGAHEIKDQYDGVALPQPALDQSYILIVDDWNWGHVRQATFNALNELGATVEDSIEIRTSFENTGLPPIRGATSEWHNGFFAAVVSKADRAAA